MDKLQVLGFEISNVKKIEFARYKFEKAGLVQITGKCASGKTSILDALKMGLLGKRYVCQEPLKNGYEKGYIKIPIGYLGNEKEIKYNIEVIFDDENPRGVMKVTDEEGLNVKGASKLFEELTKVKAFQIGKWLRADGKERVKMIEEALFDLYGNKQQYDERKKAIFEKRTETNREILKFKKKIDKRKVNENLPEKEVDIKEIIDKLNKEQEKYNTIQQKINSKNNHISNIENLKNSIETIKNIEIPKMNKEIDTEIEELKQKILNLEQKKILKEKEMFNDIDKKQEKILDEEKIIEIIEKETSEYNNSEIENLKQQFEKIDETNKLIRENNDLIQLYAELESEQNNSDDLTKKLEEMQEQKNELIAKADIPIKNLEFKNDTAYLNNVIMEQINSGEFAKIGLLLRLKLDPELKFLMVYDGNDLDDDNMKFLEEEIIKHDFIVLVEKIQAIKNCGDILELKEGRINKINSENIQQDIKERGTLF